MDIRDKSSMYYYQDGTYPDFVLLRDAFGDANNETDLILNSLNYGICGGRGRNIENGGVRLGISNGLGGFRRTGRASAERQEADNQQTNIRCRVSRRSQTNAPESQN